MLEIRQNTGVGAVTTMIFLDDLNREVGFPKVGTMATRVSDSTFYQSKEPVASPPENSCAVWLRWLENEVEAKYEKTGGGLEIIADVLQKASEDQECSDSALFNMVEGGDFDSEPFTAAREQKEHLRGYLEQLAVRMGLQHPDIAAGAALLIIERTIVWIQLTGSSRETQTARLRYSSSVFSTLDLVGFTGNERSTIKDEYGQ
jgi:hypothetical protein